MKTLRITLVAFALGAAGNATAPAKQSLTPKPVSPAEAARVLREAEEDYQRGVRFADGDGVPRDYAEAARYYKKAAIKGYIPAQYNLAYLYENGLGVNQDFHEAAVWYRKAADQGDAESQNNLGVLYATGKGVPRDDVEAVRWYRLAAKQNDFEALNNLATMYLQGRGVKRDPVQALRMCREAAENGYAAARNNLALMYANGQGVDRDYAWAYAWLDLAAAEIPSAAELRDRIAKEMTPAQIARAKQFAAQKRHEFQEKGRERK